MRILILLMVTMFMALPAGAQLKKPVNPNKAKGNQSLYAADPQWKAATAEIAKAQAKIRENNARRAELNQTIALKRQAKQPHRNESDELGRINNEQIKLNEQVAAQKLKKLAAEDRIDKIVEAQKPK